MCQILNALLLWFAFCCPVRGQEFSKVKKCLSCVTINKESQSSEFGTISAFPPGRPETGSSFQIQMNWISHRSSKNKVLSQTLHLSAPPPPHPHTHILYICSNVYVPHSKKLKHKVVNNIIRSPQTTSWVQIDKNLWSPSCWLDQCP